MTSIGGTRVGFHTFGVRSSEFMNAVSEMRRRENPVPIRDIAEKFGVRCECVQHAIRRLGLMGMRAKMRKAVVIQKPETALEHVDDMLIERGPDTEAGEMTYLVSVDGGKVSGHVCGTVPAAINDCMREWHKCVAK